MKAIRTVTVLLVFLLLLSCTVSAASHSLVDVFETALDEFYPLILKDSVQDKLNFVASRFSGPEYADVSSGTSGYYSRHVVPAPVFEATAALYFDTTAEEFRQCNTPASGNELTRSYYDEEQQMYICFPIGTCDDNVHILGYTPLGDDMYDVYYYPVIYIGYTDYGDLEKMRVRYDGDRVRLWTIDRYLDTDDRPSVLSSKTTFAPPFTIDSTIATQTVPSTVPVEQPTTSLIVTTSITTAAVVSNDPPMEPLLLWGALALAAILALATVFTVRSKK